MIWSAIIRALTILVGLLTGRALARKDGADAAIAKAKEADRERANQIRDRVASAVRPARRVRDGDGRGYRD